MPEVGLLPTLYLYNQGDECTDVTDGWHGVSINGGTYAKLAGSLNLKSTNGNSVGASINTIKAINTTHYNKLILVHSNINTNASHNYLSIQLDDTVVGAKQTTTGWAKQTDKYDISGYSGEHQISIKMVTGGTAGDGSMANYNLYEAYLSR